MSCAKLEEESKNLTNLILTPLRLRLDFLGPKAERPISDSCFDLWPEGPQMTTLARQSFQSLIGQLLQIQTASDSKSQQFSAPGKWGRPRRGSNSF